MVISMGFELAISVVIGSPHRGKVGSAKSHSSSVESTYKLGVPAGSCALRCQENKRSLSFSFSDFRRDGMSKPRGVPTGVGSAVDVRSKSLVAGEWCSGGGVSRESSLTMGSYSCGVDYGVAYKFWKPVLSKAGTGSSSYVRRMPRYRMSSSCSLLVVYLSVLVMGGRYDERQNSRLIGMAARER